MNSKRPVALFVTALALEQKAVCSFLSNIVEKEHRSGTIYEVGDFFTGSSTWEVAVVEVGKGNPSAAMEVERAIAHFAPKYAFFVGVAGGLKDVSIGDVVAADKVYGCEFGKDERQFKSRPEIGTSDYKLVQKARIVAKKNRWQKRIRQDSTPQISPCAYVGPIASGEKVVASIESNAFELLKSNYSDALAVEMEGYGFLRAVYANQVEALLVRGISDLIEGKTESDAIGSQDVAATNAAAFAFEVLGSQNISRVTNNYNFLENDNLKDSAQKLHEKYIKIELDKLYRDKKNVLRNTFKDYSRLFSIFCEFTSLPVADHIFSSLLNYVKDSNLVEPVKVVGYPGVGKSSFLQIFYWYTYLEKVKNAGNPIPIYINFHSYNMSTVNISDSISAIRKFCYTYPDEHYIFILDGIDEYASHNDYALTTVSEFTGKLKHKKIVAQRIGSEDNLSEVESVGYLLFFDRIKTKSVESQEFINTFVQLQYNTSDVQAIIDYINDSIQNCKLQEIDLFILSLIVRRYKRPGASSIGSLTDLLDQYVRSQLLDQGIRSGSVEGEIHKAAALAFRIHVAESDAETEDHTSPLLLSIVRSHTRVADFLVARYIILQLANPSRMRVSKKTLDALRYVHPYRINYLCKELLNRTVPTQHSALKTISRILHNKSFDLYQKSDACYLAGRFTDRQIKDHAKKEIKEFLYIQDIDRANFPDEEEERRYLLLVRSAFISLAYLGDRKSLYTYIDRLLMFPKWDNFNRGFHLEYYGDQLYSASVGLLSSDSSLDPFPITFDQLYDRTSNRGKNPLFELELHTLSSLAQHRHAAGKLNERKRLKLIDLLSGLLEDRCIKHSGLRSYIYVVLSHLRDQKFTVGKVMLNFLKLKNVKRQGWVSRGIDDCESVADHTVGAMVIASFFLPDLALDEEPEYNKQKILQMLFVHDLIEAKTGDLLPWDKNEEVDQQEKDLYQEFRYYGTYNGIANLSWVDELWNEFKAGNSINAKVARDIDKLENLFQLSLYFHQGCINKSTAEDFEVKLIQQIKTTYGEKILVMWRQTFQLTSGELETEKREKNEKTGTVIHDSASSPGDE